MTPAPLAPDSFEAYLQEAFERAGLPTSLHGLVRTPLTGGRTGNPVERIERNAGAPIVFKGLPGHTWRDDAMEGQDGGEARLWLDGLSNALPSQIRHPTFDVAQTATGDWWMLMQDVSAGIQPRGQFLDAHEKPFLEAIAAMHARFQDAPELETLSLATMRGTTRIWADSLIAFVDGPEAIASREPWVRKVLDDVAVISVLTPRFLDILDPEDAAFFLELCRDRAWHDALDEGPQTLVHGDLRRANIAFTSESVSLIDWEFAARGPGATDIAWHMLLHVWAYPPDPTVDPEAREALLLEHYTAALGDAYDPVTFARQYRAATLRSLTQLGFCLIDGPSKGRADRCRRALQRARSFLSDLS